MAAAEAGTSVSFAAIPTIQHNWCPLASNAACCCFCRQHLQHHRLPSLHSSLNKGLESRVTKPAVAYASWLLFAASLALVLAKNGRDQPRWRPRARRFYEGPRSYYKKKVRKPRWEWRPVTRRSSGSQTSTAESCSIAVGPEAAASVAPFRVEAEAVNGVVTTAPPSLDDFPSLSRNQQVSSSNTEVKDLAATGLEFAPALLPTDTTDSTTTTTTSRVSEQQQEQQGLNSKQRKHLKKKQKKLLAASHVLHVSSLPILKSWKSSNSFSQGPASNTHDYKKSFGPLGSPSSKSISWTFSPAAHQVSADASADALTLKPIWTLSGKPTTVHEISEISESPKSNLCDWMDETGSSRRSQSSDLEEIEMDVDSSEFEADSEDYNSFIC